MLKNINFYLGNDSKKLTQLIQFLTEDYISYFPESGRSHLELIEHYQHYYGIPNDFNKIEHNYDLALITHSESLFIYFRRLVAEQKLNHNIVNAYYLDEFSDVNEPNSWTKLSINKRGRCDKYPRKINHVNNELMILLRSNQNA